MAGTEAALGPGTTRTALRAATAGAHERLHHLRPFALLAAGSLTRTGYQALLRRLLGFHLAVEASLTAAPSLSRFGIAIADRRRSGLLRRDLDTLRAPAAGVAIAPLRPLESAGEAMGRLYVTEGATLGGRVLARGLDGILGPGEAGRAFLLGHGAQHARMWMAFCTALERCGSDSAQRAAMIGAADSTFAAFEAWFGAPGWMPEAWDTGAR